MLNGKALTKSDPSKHQFLIIEYGAINSGLSTLIAGRQ